MTSNGTTFEVRAEIRIDASPEAVYDTVTDLGRSGEWSPECTGGEWVEGRPGRVGSIFRGDNLRKPEVVQWAPVIRGHWSTEALVVEAVRPSVFRWVILNSTRGQQESTWSWEIRPDGDGCVLVHHYRLGRLTEGLAKIFAGLDEAGRERFVKEWNAKLGEDVRATVERVKIIVEKG
ncbi:SRPBCC family protein [Streptomyces litchfieldiae]|uniref:SRPBCC family protein n=1 Tax=Streptomyces litchfieldiae TaxID=3075543 RepID=A0ABU2MW32_9ACTN|nr:SRPBCC family protein [Streptomyces sp. DSM 44938]MDT0345795.1 SRPBCC family protein [Streptomyces sp. DSM 44938]